MRKGNRFFLAVYAFIWIFHIPSAHSTALCTIEQCNISIEFDNGGSLAVDNGASIRFGSEGNISLGTGGSINLGEGGSLNGIAIESLTNGLSLPENHLIHLGFNSRMEFGPGGRLILGLGGNIEYPENTVVHLAEASAVNIDSSNGATVELAGIETIGSISLIAEHNINIPYLENTNGVFVIGSDTNDNIRIASHSIVVNNILSAGTLELFAGSGLPEFIAFPEPLDCGTSQSSGNNVEITNGELITIDICSGSSDINNGGQIDSDQGASIETPTPGSVQVDPPTVNPVIPGENTQIEIGEIENIEDTGEKTSTDQDPDANEQTSESATDTEPNNPFTSADNSDGSGGGSSTFLWVVSLFIVIWRRNLRHNLSI